MKKIVYLCDGCETPFEDGEEIYYVDINYSKGKKDLHLCRGCLTKIFSTTKLKVLFHETCREINPDCSTSCEYCKMTFGPTTIV